jgi:hypothetical protein
MKVAVRPGQRWEFTDPSGATRRAFVVRVSDPIDGIRYVYLRQAGSRGPKRVPLRRLELQLEGARLVEGAEDPKPLVPKMSEQPDDPVSAPRRKTLHQPHMSAVDRKEAIAKAKWLQAHGRALGEIAQLLSVLPEIVEVWLSESSTAK